jgi:hypothetical protein
MVYNLVLLNKDLFLVLPIPSNLLFNNSKLGKERIVCIKDITEYKQ